SIVRCRILSREYEGTLREIEFFGQGLHGVRGQTARISKHGQLVPPERLIRKHIHERIVQLFHLFLILRHSFRKQSFADPSVSLREESLSKPRETRAAPRHVHVRRSTSREMWQVNRCHK